MAADTTVADAAPGAVPDPSLPDVAAFEGQWWVLHTKPRTEKLIATALRRRDVAHFLPLVRRLRRWGKRTRSVDIPLFPGYVFLCGDAEARLAALKTNRIANVLEVGDQARLRADLMQIRQALASGEPMDLYPRLYQGARCRIKSGPLAGIEGVVLRRPNLWRVYIAVHFIAQSAELEVEPALLEVID